MKTHFFLCPICGNVIVKVEDSGVIPFCCGHEMVELQPGISDEASSEKHIPTFERRDDCTVVVRVGALPHPMTDLHHICFIWLETVHGGQIRYLTCNSVHTDEARAEFCTCKDPVTAVYEYCNIHGLWKLEVNETAENACQGSCKR